MAAAKKIAVPDHRFEVYDKDGKMTPEFYKLLVEVITKLNTVLLG